MSSPTYIHFESAERLRRTWLQIVASLLTAAAGCIAPSHADEAAVKRSVAKVEQQLGLLERLAPDLSVGTDNGGEIEAWLQEGNPRKIIVWVLLSSRELKTTFYFVDDKLAAALQHERWFAWDQRRAQLDPSRTARLSETECIFDAGILVDAASRVRDGFASRAVPKDKESEVQRMADFFKRAITARPSSIDAEQALKRP